MGKSQKPRKKFRGGSGVTDKYYASLFFDKRIYLSSTESLTDEQVNELSRAHLRGDGGRPHREKPVPAPEVVVRRDLCLLKLHGTRRVDQEQPIELPQL